MKIGDRVRYIGYNNDHLPYYPKHGAYGVVVSLDSNGGIATVVWDKNSLDIECDGLAWSVPVYDIKEVES